MLINMLWLICIISFGSFFRIFALAELRNDVGTRKGCFHEGTIFANGSMVPTTEPCLSCSCNVNTLICSLRVCPEMPVPPPRGCVLVQRKNGCCPYLSCKTYHTQYDGPNRRIVAYLDHYERESIDRVVNDNVLQRRSDDSDLDVTGEICIVNGTVYKSGSAMSSSGLCSYCYCIGGVQKCVKPKCMLNMEGCKPIFVDSTCCPVRYDCSAKNAGIVKASRFQIRSGNKHYLRVIGRNQRNKGCVMNSTFYHEGQKLPSDPDRHCDICFCIKGSRKCTPKKCAPPLKNCIPVVPKGQCCPSSYDCNNTREPGRQFDLFSLLFGPENENQVDAAQQVNTPPPMHPTNNGITGVTEKSILDKIREGLEFIDNNESTVADVLKTFKIVNGTATSTAAANTKDTEKNIPEEGESMGLLDILLSDKKVNVTDSPPKDSSLAANEDVEKTTVSQTSNNNSLEEVKTTMPSTISTEQTLVAETSTIPIEYLSDEDMDDYLYSTTAEEGDDESLTVPSGADVQEERQEAEEEDLETTTDESFSKQELNNITDYEYENTSMGGESSTEVESKQNSADVIESGSSEEENFTPTSGNLQTTTPATSPTTSPATTSATNPVTVNMSPTTESESDGDFFSALFTGLSKILEPSKNKTKVNHGISNKTHSVLKITPTTMKPTSIQTSTQIETTTVNTPSEIIPATATEKTTMATSKTEPKPSTTKEKNPVTTPMNLLTPLTTEKPIVIKTNPSILEADYNFDYSEPTLPPSLPNLKIIPFLPTDAVKNDRKHLNYEYYGKLKPTPAYPSITEKHDSWGQVADAGKGSISKIDYDIGYDHTGSYPSITEAYDASVGDQHKFGFSSFDYPAAESEETKDKFDTASAVASNFDSFRKTEVPPVNRFSPPTKTEGGFVPKSPIPDQFYYDSFHTTKFLIDLTTTAPKPLKTSNTSKAVITTPDPLKDVIKTETPPDLSSLLVDKEKLLSNGAPATLFASSGGSSLADQDFEKDIISITTDATYKYTPEYKDAKDDLSATLNVTLTFEGATNKSEAIQKTSITSKPSQFVTTNFEDKQNKTTFQTTTEDIDDYDSQLGGVLDLFFKDEPKNISFKNTIPPFKTLPPDNTRFELIKTYKPGSAFGGQEGNDSVETLSILKDALLSNYEPKDSEEYKLASKAEAKITPNSEGMSFLSEPFNTLPFAKPSFQVKPSKEYHYNSMSPDLDILLQSPEDTPMKNNFNVEGYKILSTDPIISQTDSYVVNPVDINKLKQHQSGGGAQVFTKSDTSNSINDPAGILKLAGCNIYGRMYRVGRIISELSGPCLECKCTEVGVNCTPLSC